LNGSRVALQWKDRLQLVVFVLLMTGAAGFVLSSDLLLTHVVTIQAGQPATEDIAAPYRIEYPSEILTERARKSAVAQVQSVYDPLDRQIGRDQVLLAQYILDFIDSVRSDPYATPEYRHFALSSIESMNLSAQAISDTLRLSETEWKAVQLETRRVLAQVMREEIRTGQEDLYRRSVRALISFDLNEAQTNIVSEIAGALVKVNRPYNASETEAAREAAVASAPQQMRVLEENEIIVRTGEVVTLEDIEALEALGLLNPRVDWLAVSGSFLFCFVLSCLTAVYIWQGAPGLLNQVQHLLLFLLLLVLFTFLAKWGLDQSIFPPYLVPLATLGMLVTVLFGVRLGLVAHVFISLIVAYITQGQLDLVLFNLAGGLMGIAALRRASRINTFVRAGVYVILTDIVVVIAFALLSGDLQTLALGRSLLYSLAYGALSAILTLGGYYLLGLMFDITTTLQLLDLARPTHPLMRQLLLNAAGTYHHSIMVGNMAEQATEAIGADALLARVGAFYHDIGKTVRPYFFTENQMDGTNPHDLLDPETSSEIIRSHTRDGLALARKYRLPRVIRGFIAEHHGTSKIGYFYHRAVEELGRENVDVSRYMYDGPRPQTKETAIVMLADSCEAAVRSARPADAAAMEKLIRKIVESKISSHQLDDSPLTLREIEIITRSFIDTLHGVFHPRIQYPGEEQRSPEASAEGLSEVLAGTTPGTAEADVAQGEQIAQGESGTDD